MKLATIILAILVLNACGKADKVEEKAAEPAKPTLAPPAMPAPIDAGLKEHMQDHFSAIREIERAIVMGDEKAARDTARAFAAHPTSADIASYSDEILAVSDAANQIAASDSLAEMADHAATLASQCGHCHLITSSITTFEWTEAPAKDQAAKDRMHRHRWAMDRLWEGLVGPSQHSWMAGAEVLSANPMPIAALASAGIPEEEAETHLMVLQALGAKASTVTKSEERTALYGELLGTCSGCHTQVKFGK